MVENRDVELILAQASNWHEFLDKTILITGSTGRLGMYFVEALAEVNIRWNLNLRIIAQVRNQAKAEEVLNQTLNLPFIDLLIQDIVDPINFDGPIDYVFHTAGPASPQQITSNPADTLWEHICGTRNVLECARDRDAKRILYISTAEIYGNWVSEEEIGENDMAPLHCDNPRASYPVAKRACETMLASYKSQYDIDYRCFRLSHTLGPGIVLDDGRAFAEFIHNVLVGDDIVLHSDGSSIRSYTYTADAVGAMLLAFTKGRNNHYNVANNQNQISIYELAKLIAGLGLGKAVKVIRAEEAKSEYNYLNYKLGMLDTSKIKNLGWEPKVGLKDTFRWTMESIIQKSDYLIN